MGTQGSNDDCYFYYYSSCTKGDDCPFRHCEAALGTETVCSLWREGMCFRDNCKFRHMESRINRGTIQCYWEDQPSGCLKPHCVFLHRKRRLNSSPGSGGLILPVSSTGQISPSVKLTEVKDAVKPDALNPEAESYSNIDVTELNPSSHPVEPFVVSFDGEESDSESASSTPIKPASDSKYNSNSAKKSLSDNFSDFGVKTLEQIKMEKIHKESDNFYKSVYDVPYIDPVQVKMKTDASYKAECYPPQSDFVLISDRPTEKSLCANSESSEHSPETESVFKSRSLKRKSVPLYSEPVVPPKKVVSLKKNKDDPLDFKIKTLDEIRREKQNKSVNKEESSVENGSQDSAVTQDNINKISPSVISNKMESSSTNGKSFRKLKINRQSKEIFASFNVVQEAVNSNENQKKEDRTQMILHEVQNIADDQNKTEVKGKRKESDSSSESKNAKHFKSDCSSSTSASVMSTTNGSQSNAIREEKQVIKMSRPVIKRKRSTASLNSLKATSELEVSSTDSKSSISPPKENGASPKEDNSLLTVKETDKKMSKSSISPPKENGTSPKEDNSLLTVKETDKKMPKSSVDELDSFLMNETDVNLDYEPDGSINESDDILLEIEQLLDS